MKILVVPDMHGSHAWERARDMVGDVEHIVFLGDWVDNWDNDAYPDQDVNMQNSFDFCREDPEHRHWCIGNHDWSYMSVSREGGMVSGHQHRHADAFRDVLDRNRDLIHFGVELDGWVFSHAGFSSVWKEYMLACMHHELDRGDVKWDESEFSLSFIEGFMREHFNGTTCRLLDWHGCYDGSGNEAMQGPLWIRPEALLRHPLYQKQVVGHTELCYNGEPVRLRNGDTEVMIVDSEGHDILYVFDTGNPGDFLTIPEFNRAYKYWVKDQQRRLSRSEDNDGR